MLPDKVRIGAIDYDVKLADNMTPNSGNENGIVLGEIVYRKALIYLSPDQNPQVMRQTLMHEIAHGILHQAGHYENDEAIVTALGYGLTALIRGNPDLIRYIREDIHEANI